MCSVMVVLQQGKFKHGNCVPFNLKPEKSDCINEQKLGLGRMALNLGNSDYIIEQKPGLGRMALNLGNSDCLCN